MRLLSSAAINLALGTIAAVCLIPFWVVIAASFSSERALVESGYSLVPRGFNTLAYRYLLVDSAQVLRSYGVSVTVTLVGTALGLFVMALLAYAISRRTFKLRRALAFYVFFTMLFSGGLVPSYILIT